MHRLTRVALDEMTVTSNLFIPIRMHASEIFSSGNISHLTQINMSVVFVNNRRTASYLPFSISFDLWFMIYFDLVTITICCEHVEGVCSPQNHCQFEESLFQAHVYLRISCTFSRIIANRESLKHCWKLSIMPVSFFSKIMKFVEISKIFSLPKLLISSTYKKLLLILPWLLLDL